MTNRFINTLRVLALPKKTTRAGFDCKVTGRPMFNAKYDCPTCGAPGYFCRDVTLKENDDGTLD